MLKWAVRVLALAVWDNLVAAGWQYTQSTETPPRRERPLRPALSRYVRTGISAIEAELASDAASRPTQP